MSEQLIEETKTDELTCAGMRADGERCESTILLDDGYCIAHSPSRAKPADRPEQKKHSFWRAVAADAEHHEQRKREAREAETQRQTLALEKKRERDRQRRREAFWGKELIAVGRGVRFCWRYSRSAEYRAQIRKHLVSELAASIGPAYRAWTWERAYRNGGRDERRQMLAHALFGKRAISAWRFVRNAEHRAKTKARWRYRTVNKLYTAELRTLVKISRTTARFAARGSRALARAYKQQWHVGAYKRDGRMVSGYTRRRRAL